MAVLNATFRMTCNLLMMVNDARGNHMEKEHSRASHDCLVCSYEYLLLFAHTVAVSVFIICRGMYACTEMLLKCVWYLSWDLN